MNDPWYKRTEFWTTLLTSIGGLLAATHSTNPAIQNISAVAAAASPLVYSFGRAQVKKAMATPAPLIATTAPVE